MQKDPVPNIFGLNVRPSSGEIVSPTSEESGRRSIRKDHLSKENRYQMAEPQSDNDSDLMSLESIVIKKEEKYRGIKRSLEYQNSHNDSVEEAFTPNFITKRSSIGEKDDKLESGIFYKHPPLVSVLDSDGHRYSNSSFTESMEGSEQIFSSNREDVEEFKHELKFPSNSSR